MLILLVEDDAVTQTVIKGFLESDGHRVDVAEDGQAAVDAVSTGNHDLVLMDMHLTTMDGHAATHLIRALGTVAASIPIIAVTSGASVSACLAAGMNDFVLKPVEPDDLRNVIARIAAPGRTMGAMPDGDDGEGGRSDRRENQRRAAGRPRLLSPPGEPP